MAKKGQKFQKYTEEEKTKIILEYVQGKESLECIAGKYKITGRKTVYNWLKKYRNTGTIKNEKRGGSLKEEKIDYKARYEI